MNEEHQEQRQESFHCTEKLELARVRDVPGCSEEGGKWGVGRK